jgi:hypothetical protein
MNSRLLKRRSICPLQTTVKRSFGFVEAQRSGAVLVGGNNYLSPPLPTQASPKQEIERQLIVMKIKYLSHDLPGS